MLLCAATIGCATAQRGSRAMQRIDRDIQEAVFIPKGTWMV